MSSVLIVGVACATEAPEATSAATEPDLDAYCAQLQVVADRDRAPQDLKASLRKAPPLARGLRKVQELAPDDVADDWDALVDTLEQMDRVVAEHGAVDSKARKHDIMVALLGEEATPPGYDPQQLEDLRSIDHDAADRADTIIRAHTLEQCGVDHRHS